MRKGVKKVEPNLSPLRKSQNAYTTYQSTFSKDLAQPFLKVDLALHFAKVFGSTFPKGDLAQPF